MSLTESIGSSLQVLDQSNVTLKCNASGVPQPLISWSKDGNPLDVTGPFLKISRIEQMDEGRYTCTATNFRGADIRSTVVSVVGK